MVCFASLAMTRSRSPDGAQRNPGFSQRFPGFAALHPGYGFNLQTSRVARHSFAISRHDTPEVALEFPQLSNRRAQGKPGARCTRGLVCKNAQQNAHEQTGSAEAIRLSLRDGLQLTPRSPRRPAFLPPSLADLPSANLMPAPGHQDHTASPSTSGALVRRTVRVHRIPLHVRDDRERPSERSGTGRACRDDLPDETSGIFLSKGLDDPNHVDPARQIGFCAQAAGALGATVHPPGGHGFALDA